MQEKDDELTIKEFMRKTKEDSKEEKTVEQENIEKPKKVETIKESPQQPERIEPLFKTNPKVNITAKFLKIMSVIIFTLCFIGSVMISTVENKVYDTDLWGDVNYTIEEEFNSGLFLGLISTSTLICSATYGLGELIQKQHNTENILKNIEKEMKKK